MKIAIITPCSRPQNLEAIKRSINIPCEWFIVYDTDEFVNNFSEEWIIELSTKGGIAGKKQVNLALDHLTEEYWFYVLDDDNLLHPKFRKLYDLMKISSSIGGYIFGQDLGGGNNRIPTKNNIRVCHVDQAQYTLSMKLVKDKRYIQKYEADGHFIEEIYHQHADEILVVHEILSFYNKLT